VRPHYCLVNGADLLIHYTKGTQLPTSNDLLIVYLSILAHFIPREIILVLFQPSLTVLVRYHLPQNITLEVDPCVQR